MKIIKLKEYYTVTVNLVVAGLFRSMLLLLFGNFGDGLDDVSSSSSLSSSSLSSSMSSPGDSGSSSLIGDEVLVLSGLPKAARALLYNASEVAEFWYSAS